MTSVARPVVALLGGTSDTFALAEGLLAGGAAVAVSTATDQPLRLPEHPALARRIGRLDRAAMVEWLRAVNARVLLDATHPYATEVRALAPLAARDAGVAYVGYLRPSGLTGEGAAGSAGMAGFASHEAAAAYAFSLGRGVLVTTGSRHIAVYAESARRSGLPWAARVLDRGDSVAACLACGLARERIIAATGPFSVEDNVRHLRDMDCGVLVTKDGGAAGGMAEKAEAARRVGAALVVVTRPEEGAGQYATATEAVAAAMQALATPGSGAGIPFPG